jgi:hypothetical protein
LELKVYILCRSYYKGMESNRGVVDFRSSVYWPGNRSRNPPPYKSNNKRINKWVQIVLSSVAIANFV